MFVHNKIVLVVSHPVHKQSDRFGFEYVFQFVVQRRHGKGADVEVGFSAYAEALPARGDDAEARTSVEESVRQFRDRGDEVLTVRTRGSQARGAREPPSTTGPPSTTVPPDTAAPKVTAIDDSPDPVFTGGSTRITATVTDQSRIATVELWQLVGKSWVTFGQMKLVRNQYQIDFGPLNSAGVYQWRILAIDVHGNATCGTSVMGGCPGGATTAIIP